MAHTHAKTYTKKKQQQHRNVERSQPTGHEVYLTQKTAEQKKNVQNQVIEPVRESQLNEQQKTKRV